MAAPHDSPQTIGKYRILKELGSGGFGAVYLAEDPKLQLKVAIKIFKIREVALALQATSATSEAGKVLHDRFLSEARILRQLSTNANIVDVYEFDELADGTPYYVMPYLEKSLVDQIGKDALTSLALDELPSELRPRKLTVPRAVQILTQVLTGLAEVHDANLIHRDIKPANILFDAKGNAQICDFGIAKTPEDEHSHTGTCMGSRHYMSPEQRESAKHVTPSSDVYSVGVMAYRMLTATLPIGRFDDPIDYSPGIGKALNKLILDAMKNTPSDRPSNARELLQRLKQAVQQLDESAPVVSDETSTEMGEVQQTVRDELKPLEQRIARILLDDAEISAANHQQLRMMATIVELNEEGLQQLVDVVEKRLAPKLKPARNFLKLVDAELSQSKGRLTKASLNLLMETGLHSGLPEARLKQLIAKRQPDATASEVDSDKTTSAASTRSAKKSKSGRVLVLLLVMGGLGGGAFWYKGHQNQQTLLVKQLATAEANEQKASEQAEPYLENAQASIAVLQEKVVLVQDSLLRTQTAEAKAMLNRLGLEMVRIPSGSYQMGSNKGSDAEKPVHRVSISAFKMGKTEVTFAQWDVCVVEGGCVHKPSDDGWGRGSRPVINVSYNDITQEYLPWLSKITGQQYRLPSESEWEYAARAGSSAKYSWGNDMSCSKARYGYYSNGCGKQKSTDPVGSFSATGNGLYDMHGNVWEWTQDCWNSDYRNAYSNNRANAQGDCGSRVLRGGSWINSPESLHSSFRTFGGRAYRNVYNGFRLAQD